MRPTIFLEPLVALCNLPYSFGFTEDDAGFEGGVLHQGQIVWAQTSAMPLCSLTSEAVFLEGVGIISVNPHWLTPANSVKVRTDDRQP